MKPTTISLSVLVLVLSGCGGGVSHQPTEKYVLVCPNPKIPYWQEVGAGLSQAARELKVQAEMVGPDAYDANAERQEFKRIMAGKPAGVLVSPGSPEILQPEIDAAIASGVPVITVDSDAPQSRRLFFVGTNNYEAGQLGGRLLAKLMNGRGNAVFYTIGGQKNIEERLNGYRAALQASPGIKVAQLIDMKGDPHLAFDATQDLIDKKTPVDAFVSLESLSGNEVAEVLERNKVAGKLIVAMDTSGNTLSWIEKGRIAATIMQKPFTMGYYSLMALAEIALRKPAGMGRGSLTDPKAPFPVFIDTGTMVVDKSNLGELKK
jgi:ribose transport system substrate-binding protein